MNPVVVAITGASGAMYGRELVKALLASECPVELVLSEAGERVAREELDLRYDAAGLEAAFGERVRRIHRHPAGDIGASVASGSYPVQGMAICPCSVGTAARIAAGLSTSLIERAADVQLKERRPLVLVVRETPLSTLHLENLLRLSRCGAIILPASPGFYGRPRTLDDLVSFVVERTLEKLGIGGPRKVAWTGAPR